MKEVSGRTMLKILLAEGIGTFILTAAVVALETMSSSTSIASFGYGAVFAPLAIAFVVIAVIYMFGPFTGANLNPAVTIGLAVYKKLPWAQVPVYIGAQILGALGGVAMVRFMMGIDLLTVTTYANTAERAVGGFFGGLVLLLVIMLAVLGRIKSEHAPVAIGLAFGAALMTATVVSGVSLNPAIAAGLLTDFSSWGTYLFSIIGGVAGASLAIIIHEVAAGE
jgi:glycerol uptake facilitator-like aquaporin